MRITVAIPTIPPRSVHLKRAIESVAVQTRPAEAVSIATDTRREGAARTRQRALEAVRTEWTAFLDDDDQFFPAHLAKLTACARETGADYVFSHYIVQGGTDPHARWFGVPWDDARPRQTTITVLVRTELAKLVGFQTPQEGRTIDGQRWGEDYSFTLGCLEAGAKIVHLPEKTWFWHHHSGPGGFGNTSGRPDRW